MYFWYMQELSEELKDAKGSFHYVKCDLSIEDDILSMFQTIEDKFGGADVVINNAGVGANAPLLSGKTEDWKNFGIPTRRKNGRTENETIEEY